VRTLQDQQQSTQAVGKVISNFSVCVLSVHEEDKQHRRAVQQNMNGLRLTFAHRNRPYFHKIPRRSGFDSIYPPTHMCSLHALLPTCISAIMKVFQKRT
jgi:hypothetical protein